MADQLHNPYQTLPTLLAPMVGEAPQQGLVLTILFHPDTRRIGERALVDKPGGQTFRELGRHSLFFKFSRESARPLDDPYVSREAIRLDYHGRGVVLSRAPGSSRAHVGGAELVSRLELDEARLAQGVPMVLGGRVVLLLRRTEVTRPGAWVDAGPLVGSSAYMQGLRRQIRQLGSTDFDVLVCGETGTGKELVAEAIHAASGGSGGKMVAVNMAAIPVSLAPSLLFGSARGAFSGAAKPSVGYFEQARGGTLFLDEIGDTPEEIQPQLLRVLQQREIQCVGGPVRKVQLRVVSATDAPLDDQSCNFKAALRHRLGEAEIALLPLREHPEDIGELAWAFLHRALADLGRESVLPHPDSSPAEVARWAEVFYRFGCYHWPGNVRELGNYARQVAVASEAEATLPRLVMERLTPRQRKVTPADTAGGLSEKAFLEGLQRAGFEVARAARLLGISRQAVYRRIAESPELCLADELSDDTVREALDECNGDMAAAAMRLRVSRTALRARLRHAAVS